MEKFLKNFGRKLKRYRQANYMSQRKLAKMLDVTAKTVSWWENGKTFIAYNHLFKLCEIFETIPEELFCFADKNQVEQNPELNQIYFLIEQEPVSKQKKLIEIVKAHIEVGNRN